MDGEAVVADVAEELFDLRALEEGLGRDATPVEAGAAGAFHLDADDFFPKLGRANGPDITGRAATNDDEIVVHKEVVTLTQESCQKTGDLRVVRHPISFSGKKEANQANGIRIEDRSPGGGRRLGEAWYWTGSWMRLYGIPEEGGSLASARSLAWLIILSDAAYLG